jgi:lipopolysaccharide transport system ATP-binding protein
MKDIAICVDKLSKRYRIGARQKREATLRKRLVNMLASPFEYLSASLRPPTEDETLWALKDVSFEVQHGEVLGIIGRNGAGKSTLLKILSRITEPTSGTAALYGRVGSLLEVGTGFHPELTGRENVYMNGAILGMRRAEIDAKFDEIVDFAGVEKFIDTPVKRYSSGMYVRLGFAVAAHLEPEILIVDEVLAVGDAEFQKKCLGKMGEVAKGGRTVLFVSHNMASVSSLCTSVVFLDKGEVSSIGQSEAILQEYLALSRQNTALSLADRVDRTGNGEACLVGIKFSNVQNGAPQTEFMLGGEVFITLNVHANKAFRAFVGVQVKDHLDRLIFAFNSRESGYWVDLGLGENNITLHIPFLPLLPGTYFVSGGINREDTLERCDRIEDILSFQTYTRDILNSGLAFTAYHGVTYIAHEWINHNKISKM